MVEADRRVARYTEILADGRHLLSRFQARTVHVDGADLAMEIDVDETLAGPSGALQGGLVATLVDTVAASAASIGAPRGSIVATGDMTIHFLAPVLTTAHAVAHVIRRGRRTIVCRVDVFDRRDGPLAAACQLSFAMITPRAGTPPGAAEKR
jgi:uncharacterized protein (TIGR00369 family)